MTKEIEEQVEETLRGYLDAKSRLQYLSAERDNYVRAYRIPMVSVQVSETSDPTSDAVDRITELDQEIAELRILIARIDAVMAASSSKERKFVWEKYFRWRSRPYSDEGLARELGISVASLYRMRSVLLERFAKSLNMAA